MEKRNQHSRACFASLCPTSISASSSPSKDSQLAKERLKISLKKKKHDFLQSEGNFFFFFPHSGSLLQIKHVQITSTWHNYDSLMLWSAHSHEFWIMVWQTTQNFCSCDCRWVQKTLNSLHSRGSEESKSEL